MSRSTELFGNDNNNMSFAPVNHFGLLEPTQDDSNWFYQAVAGLKPVSQYSWGSHNYAIDEEAEIWASSSSAVTSYKDAGGTHYSSYDDFSYEENTDLATNVKTVQESQSTTYSLYNDDEYQSETTEASSFSMTDGEYNYSQTSDMKQMVFFNEEGMFSKTTENTSSVVSDEEHFYFDRFFENIEKAMDSDGNMSTNFDFNFEFVNTDLTNFSVEQEQTYADGLITQTEDDGISLIFQSSTFSPAMQYNFNAPSSVYVELENIESVQEFFDALGEDYAPAPIVFEVAELITEFTGEDLVEVLGSEIEALTNDANLMVA